MTENMMERLLDFEVSEELELICFMIGFGLKVLVYHLGDGFFRWVELEAR